MIGDHSPGFLQERARTQMTRRVAQIDCDEERDMRAADSKVKRALYPGLAFIAVSLVLWVCALGTGDSTYASLYGGLLAGLVIGCAGAVVLRLMARENARSRYRLERERALVDFGDWSKGVMLDIDDGRDSSGALRLCRVAGCARSQAA